MLMALVQLVKRLESRLEELEMEVQRLRGDQTLSVVGPLELTAPFGMNQALSLSISSLVEDVRVTGSGVVKVVDGTLHNGKYDGVLLQRDNSDEDWVERQTHYPIWIVDLSGSSTMDVNSEWTGVYAYKEVGGKFYMAIDSAKNSALTDTTKWLPLETDPLSIPAWSAGTYIQGKLVTHSGNTWLEKTSPNTSGTPGVSSDWLQVVPNDEEAFQADQYYVGDYVQEIRDVYAIRFSVGTAGSGIVDINDNSTVHQTVGIGMAGIDINIATAGVAYSAGVTYSKGWIVTNGGSTYRYINATPTAGNAPPNGTYWVDVTGDGLNVVNVPDWSTTARGIFTTGDQTGHGTKTLETVMFGLAGKWKATTDTDARYAHLNYEGLKVETPSTGQTTIVNSSGMGISTTSPSHGCTVSISAGSTDIADAKVFNSFTHNTIFSVEGATYGGILWTTDYLGTETDWNSGTAYVVNNVVKLNGSSYVCILNHTNQQPPNVTYWTLIGTRPFYSVQYGSPGVRFGGLWATVSGLSFSGGLYTGGTLSITTSSITDLSSWAGSSAITTLGTVTTGVWQGTAIADTYISSASTWNAKLSSGDIGSTVQGWNIYLDTISGTSPVADGTYTVGAKLTGGGVNGTITTTNGIITAVQQAT